MTQHAVIFAGGTGGHVFPALAVAEQLRDQGWQVSWVGTEHRIEARVVPAAGFAFYPVPQQGLRGNGLRGYLQAPFGLTAAVWKLRKLLRELKADIVLGFGGYTAGPGGVAAKLAGIPLVIHEQNAVPGLTNRLLSRIANRTLVGFQQAAEHLSDAQWVGNPVRTAIWDKNRDVSRGQAPARLLVVGGSLGAQVLNETVPAALARWRGEPLQVTHQVGEGRVEETLERYQHCAPGVTVEVRAFIDDMATAYASHDLVVCRAGALTVAELAAAGIGSVLVPYPHAVDDHQTRNAEVLVMNKAAVLIAQPKLTADSLAATLEELIALPWRLEDMGQAARAVARQDATGRIVEQCVELTAKQVTI